MQKKKINYQLSQVFESQILKAMKEDGWDGFESDDKPQWSFTGALFYSIIVITTIGECKFMSNLFHFLFSSTDFSSLQKSLLVFKKKSFIGYEEKK